MGRRVAAWVVDSVIILVPSIAAFTSDLEYLEEADLDQSATDFCEEYMDREEGVCVEAGDRVYFSDGVPVAPWAVALGLSILINVLIQGLRGWTPGKLLFGIRTVAGDGRAPGIGRAIIRWLLLLVDGLCGGLVGLIVALTSTGHRRVGDMAAKTYVVGKQYMGHPIVVPGMSAAYPTPPYSGGPEAPGGPGGGWGAQPGPPPGEQPQSWAPPPTWGPAPTWGGPPEVTPDEARPDESPPPAEAEPVEAPPEPRGRADAVVSPEPAQGGEPTTAETATPDYNPQWDPVRGTYILWSAERGHWLGWDDAAKEWKPL
jgi:RDD family